MSDDVGMMTGPVEIDETYVGGKARIREWAKDNKTTVFGIVERGGSVTTTIAPRTQRSTLMPHIVAHVAIGATTYTDDAKVYRGLPKAGFAHESIDHSARVYVSGNVHTQTIDGFWSLVKRGISGTYHSVSPKYLHSYVNEFAWRYNRRDAEQSMFASLILSAANGD